MPSSCKGVYNSEEQACFVLEDNVREAEGCEHAEEFSDAVPWAHYTILRFGCNEHVTDKAIFAVASYSHRSYVFY